jgi:hypothetical protein
LEGRFPGLLVAVLSADREGAGVTG